MSIDPVLFPARTLTAYAEPVGPSELREGEVYYSVTFLDDKLLVPSLEPLVYLGTGASESDPLAHRFQDAESYLRSIKGEGEVGEETLFEGSQTKHIFSFDKAIDVLCHCLLRRQKHEQKEKDRTGEGR